MTACNNLVAASHSPTAFKMFASIPTADHRHGINRALKATLAARKATLKPRSGFPIFLKRSALEMSVERRCMMSAPCALNDVQSESMELNASE